MLGLLNTVLTRGGSLLTYVKEGLVMANRFLTPPKLTFPVNGSAEFDGASDYFTSSAVPMPSGGSLLFWYRTTQTSAVDFVSSGQAVDDFRIILNARVGFYTGAEYRPNSNTFWNTSGEWDHFALTWDSNGTKLYFLGSEKASNGTAPADYSSVPTTTYFGCKYNETDFLDGNLANGAIWNRALSSDEINSVMWKSYEKLTTTESNGLQAWYKLQESELISGDSTATLEKYAAANSLTFEGKTCLQTALNALPTITDARLYSAKYDIRVSADGGNVESLNCVETELNAIL